MLARQVEEVHDQGSKEEEPGSQRRRAGIPKLDERVVEVVQPSEMEVVEVRLKSDEEELKWKPSAREEEERPMKEEWRDQLQVALEVVVEEEGPHWVSAASCEAPKLALAPRLLAPTRTPPQQAKVEARLVQQEGQEEVEEEVEEVGEGERLEMGVKELRAPEGEGETKSREAAPSLAV